MEHKKHKLSASSKPSIVADFARRTIKNLEVIENQDIPESEIYEITQLINSLVGIAVFPNEHDLHCFPTDQKSDSNLLTSGLSAALTNQINGEKLSLRQVVEYLRHATAHFCIKFISTNNQITEIHLWNHPGGDTSKEKDWELIIAPNELRNLVLHIASHLQKLCKSNPDDPAISTP